MALYEHESPVNEVHFEGLVNFVQDVYGVLPNQGYAFSWHGLMGYTQNGVRMIGPDPRDPKLIYNLGCNGVGLLPSILGGDRVARYLAGEKLEPSMFDIRKDS
jgi:glycine/D-amino acid oxidase-like deaminating enzyme